MTERQSARMSKITNDGLTLSSTGWYTAIAVPICNSGRQRINSDSNVTRDKVSKWAMGVVNLA